MRLYDKSFTEKFWKNVNKSGDCWIWTGYKDYDGYGRIELNYRNLGAHRVSWELDRGKKIPQGMLICHHCDNPSCVNPKHLFSGTHKDNAKDAVAKGKMRGESMFTSRLKENDVLKIRKEYKKAGGHGSRTLLARRLSKEFGVHYTTIINAATGSTWKHLPDACEKISRYR